MSVVLSRMLLMYGITAAISFSVAILMKGMFMIVRLTRRNH